MPGLPKAYKLADGYGMFLLVNPSGSRLWRLKYRFAGKEKRLGLGGYPEVGREYRDDARRLLNEGKDPAAERKAAKRSMRLTVENAFEEGCSRICRATEGPVVQASCCRRFAPPGDLHLSPHRWPAYCGYCDAGAARCHP
jgi:hypothetical protein